MRSTHSQDLIAFIGEILKPARAIGFVPAQTLRDMARGI
jgi:hypothetical protein